MSLIVISNVFLNYFQVLFLRRRRQHKHGSGTSKWRSLRDLRHRAGTYGSWWYFTVVSFLFLLFSHLFLSRFSTTRCEVTSEMRKSEGKSSRKQSIREELGVTNGCTWRFPGSSTPWRNKIYGYELRRETTKTYVAWKHGNDPYRSINRSLGDDCISSILLPRHSGNVISQKTSVPQHRPSSPISDNMEVENK